MQDCKVEDRTVTDTKMDIFDSYIFCIVDTIRVPQAEASENPSSGVGKDQKREGFAANVRWQTQNMNIILFNDLGGAVTVHDGPMAGWWVAQAFDVCVSERCVFY